jgi:Protein of unknown function (DUF3043).
VPSLFRRRSQTAESSGGSAEPTAESPVADSGDGHSEGPARAGVKPKAYTPGKGRPTPKRREARKAAAEPPPKDRKEAYRRTRDKQRAERAEAREGMMRGDEQYLPLRDRGPERAIARDIVDARRNIGTWFFAGVIVILIGTWPTIPQQIQDVFDLLWVVLLAAVIIDSMLLCRLVKRIVWQRHPKTDQGKPGLYFYVIMRSLTLRRMRIPRPRVSVGDEI